MLALRVDAARRLGCEVTALDPETGYLAEIRRGTSRHLLLGGFSPLNNACAARLAEDKFHTARILERAGFRVPSVARCLRPGRFQQEDFSSHTGIAPALRFAEEHGFPLVAKPNRGARGRHVSVVRGAGDLTAAVERIWEFDYLAVVQPLAAGIDVRLDFLDGEFLTGYRRRPVVLHGDGTSTLEDLLARSDPRFRGADFRDALAEDPIWTEATRPRRLGFESVLADGEILDLGTPILNLNRLCLAEIVEEPDPAWVDQGRRIGEVMGLRHYGIDFKTEDPDGDPAAATVLEVNASPSLVQMSRLGRYEDALAAEVRVVEALLASRR